MGTADKSDDDIDPEQFARILELLTNPKLKNILRPEIADALEDNLSVLQKTDSFEHRGLNNHAEIIMLRTLVAEELRGKGLMQISQRFQGPFHQADEFH